MQAFFTTKKALYKGICGTLVYVLLLKIYGVSVERRELSAVLQEAAADLADLRELQQIVDSDAYIERVARDQLGMVRPNEIVFAED